MPTYIFDEIIESDVNPQNESDGFGSIEENEGRYWFNTTSKVMFYHDGTAWTNFDSAHKLSVTRNDVIIDGQGSIKDMLNAVMFRLDAIESQIECLNKILTNHLF